MGLFSRNPKPHQEQILVQLRTDIYNIQRGEDTSRLQFSGTYTADGEPVYQWRVPNRVDKKIVLERVE